MSMIVVLSCADSSISFQKKSLTLEEGNVVVLGRARGDQRASPSNGYFDYPEQVEMVKLSRNHAEITCKESKIHLKAINKNTFVNGGVAPLNVWTEMESNDCVILGGAAGDRSLSDSVIFIVKIFNSADENYKYFRLLEQSYPFNCQWPDKPPTFSITTELLHAIAKHRLDVLLVLAGFEENDLTSTKNHRAVIAAMKENPYVEMLTSEHFHSRCRAEYEFKKNDHVSQYVLAIACCRSYRSKLWFINQERKFFRLRWTTMFPQEQADFLVTHGMSYPEVSRAELSELRPVAEQFFPDSFKYYKVHYTEVPSLIKLRRAYVQSGFCYVSVENMSALIVEKLQKILLRSLRLMQLHLSKIWKDERIRCIIHYVEAAIRCSSRHKSAVGAIVTEKNIHQLCDESFPLCMKILQLHLTKDHHLRNGGRFQYTLFLKGIGLSLPNSMHFWKTHFTRKIEENVFMNRYSYHIRHAYGSEGKMADYPPQNCSEVFRALPGPLEYHGCPFKVLDEIRMKEALYRSGLKKEDYGQILIHVRNGAPQDACREYFELTHNASYPHKKVDHPNLYFDESRKVIRCRKEKVKINEETTQRTALEKPSTSKMCLDW